MNSSTLTALYVRTATALRSFESNRTEPGFEIAQSMGIALLGLVVAATFAGLLEALGVEIIQGIRDEIGL